MTVDDYLAAQPGAVQRVLARVRSTIRKALPRAEEVISYQIPAYRVDGRVAIYFAGWTHHYSIYPCTAGVVAAFAEALDSYQLSKGTIRFPLEDAVPVVLIAGIAKVRARETLERAAARKLAQKKR